MPERAAVVAVDVGGTKIACGLFLEDGQALFERTEPTGQTSAESSIGQIAALTRTALDAAPDGVAVRALGIVVPGWVDRAADTVWAPNVEGWDRIPLRRALAEKVTLPVLLDSDRSGYVKGEAWLGIARGLTDVVFLAVGTGIGAGILSGGRLVRGHDDLAGAVGWMALNPEFGGLYADVGCFEAEASGTAVGRKGAQRLARSASDAGSLSAIDILGAAAAGDSAAAGVLDEAALYIGMGVANLVSTLNPQMVVLGGGLFQNGKMLAGRVRREFLRWTQPFAARLVRVELSTLGARAGLLGAARIAFDNI